MKITSRTPLRGVALAVGQALADHGIRAVLTGGACATIYSEGSYISEDVDFVLEGRVLPAALDLAMADCGFRRDVNRYLHPKSPFWVEFPRGPLAVGGDLRVEACLLGQPGSQSLALSPTDSCRDRLAAFYHWNDLQSLEVAVEIAARHEIDQNLVRSWSESEGRTDRYQEFLRRVARRGNRRAR